MKLTKNNHLRTLMSTSCCWNIIMDFLLRDKFLASQLFFMDTLYIEFHSPDSALIFIVLKWPNAKPETLILYKIFGIVLHSSNK